MLVVFVQADRGMPLLAAQGSHCDPPNMTISENGEMQMDVLKLPTVASEAEYLKVLSRLEQNRRDVQESGHAIKDVATVHPGRVCADEEEVSNGIEDGVNSNRSQPASEDEQGKQWCFHQITGSRGFLYLNKFAEEGDRSTLQDRTGSESVPTSPGRGNEHLETVELPSQEQTEQDSNPVLNSVSPEICSNAETQVQLQDAEDGAAGSGPSERPVQASELFFKEMPDQMAEEHDQGSSLSRNTDECEVVAHKSTDISMKPSEAFLECVLDAEEETATDPTREGGHRSGNETAAATLSTNRAGWRSGASNALTMDEKHLLQSLSPVSAQKMLKVYSRKSKKAADDTRSVDLPYTWRKEDAGSDASALGLQLMSTEEAFASSCGIECQTETQERSLILPIRGSDHAESGTPSKKSEEFNSLACFAAISPKGDCSRALSDAPGMTREAPDGSRLLFEAMVAGDILCSDPLENSLGRDYNEAVQDMFNGDPKISVQRKYWLRGDKEQCEMLSFTPYLDFPHSDARFFTNFGISREMVGLRKGSGIRCLLDPVERTTSRTNSCFRREDRMMSLEEFNKLGEDFIRKQESSVRVDESGGAKDCCHSNDEARQINASGTSSDGGHRSLQEFAAQVLIEEELHNASGYEPNIESVEEDSDRLGVGLKGNRNWTQSDCSSSKRRKTSHKVLPRKQRQGRDRIYLRTRSCTFLGLRKFAGEVIGTGPILRSQKNAAEKMALFLNERLHRRGFSQAGNRGKVLKRTSSLTHGIKKTVVRALLEKYLRNKAMKLRSSGNPISSENCLPFLTPGAKRLVECFCCKKPLFSGKGVYCAYKDCHRGYHDICARGIRECSWRKNGEFICPQHVCMACRRGHRTRVWRCERCPVAAHSTCFAFPNHVFYIPQKLGRIICWRHPGNWRSESEPKTPTNDTQEIFNRLPLPYAEEDFNISYELQKEVIGNESEPAPYIHIRRNMFLVKKKRDDADDGVACTCSSVCGEDCECRVQTMSCSKTCRCKEHCTNRPFRKEKRIKLVRTKLCGWGAESHEAIKKGEFVIEYIGEVINDAICEERLWAMKERGVQNFYMCEIGKDFIIDATFKGNPSRFLNHSCNPNCNLEKWRVDGETRVGVFALRDIKVGEPLTYDYRFVQFGPHVKCCCGAPNCRGHLGEQFSNKARVSDNAMMDWGSKQKRSFRRHKQILKYTLRGTRSAQALVAQKASNLVL